MIPYGRHEITQKDIDEVVKVLHSDFLTQGPMVPRFEQAVVSYCGAKYGVAVNSGTSALHIACLSLGLGVGDILWTTPNTFVASANCGRYCGASIDFVDIDPDTWNISTEALREKLIVARKNNCLPKILVSVHFAGQPPEQEKIWELSQEFGFNIIEDASHAIGASRNDEQVGSCRWSDITIFSFHPVKIITTAEGGMALTNDEDLSLRMQMLRTHGITRNIEQMEFEPPGSWYYEQIELGFNYRMTDIQAALGISQLARIDEYILKRNSIANEYISSLSGMPLRLPVVLEGNMSAFHLFVIRIDLEKIKLSYGDVFDKLKKSGINVNLHYMSVHLQPYYKNLGFSAGMFPEAEQYAKEAITLPLYPILEQHDQDYVIKTLSKILV